MADSDLNRAKFSGADFNTHNDDLRARLQIRFAADYNDFAISAQGIMLLDLVAFGLSTLSFYLDRRATDTYLTTARTTKSVARTTRQLGYKMGGSVASGVDIQVSVTTPKAVDIPLIKGFQFKGPNELIFEVAEATTFTPAEQAAGTSKLIPCFEGETLNETFVSDGTANQIFELRRVPDEKFVVQGSVEVLVNGSAFTESDLLTKETTDQFEVGYNDEPPTIRFGDGIAGNIPTTSATIDVTYAASRGREGQVASGTITETVNPLVVAFETIGLAITNPSPSAGGDNPETIESAKIFGPQVFKSRKAGVVVGDYTALAGSYADPLFGRVAVAKAISSRSAATDLTLSNLINDINVAIATFNPTIATQTTAGLAALDTLDTNVATAQSELSTTVTENTAIQTANTTIGTEEDTIAEEQVKIAADSAQIGSANGTIGGIITSISNDAIAARNLVISYGPSGTADLTQVQEDAVTTLLNNIIQTQLASLETARDQIDSNNTTLAASNTTIGTSNASIATEQGNITTASANVATNVGNAITPLQTVQVTDSPAVRAALDAIVVANSDVATDINTATAAINDHVDGLLSDDCKANLVTVPILTKDAGGFYIAPPTGLIISLQNFMDERKEVTHTVAVTSGVSFLVSADVTVRLGVLRGFSTEVVRTSVESAIDGLLRDRKFGAILYELDVERAVDEVEGVRFSNVTITSTGGTIDADGNLIVQDSEVITKGTVTVNPELVNET